MRRLVPSALLLLGFVLSFAVLAPAPAHAHGIVVVDGDVIVVQPPDRRRPLPPRHVPPPVRLKEHRVEAVIKDRVADVMVEQVFHNDSGRQLEGTYLFPLPEGASVARFAMTMGGKMVEGEIMEATQARQIYEDIVRRRRDPGLLEYLGRGLFRARVFPIEPHRDLTIRLSFQQILPESAGTLEMRYPLSTDRLHGQAVESVVLSVTVESPVDIKAIYSPSHDVAITREGNRRAKVSYERSGQRQDRDFVLFVGRSPEEVGFSLLSSKAAGDEGTFLAVFAPSHDVPEDKLAPKDVVYVLDTSGSMAQDDKIGQARRALEYGVRVLRPVDRFNIIAFAGEVRPFRDGLVPASAEVKDAASAWIRELRAAGGTNIEGALAEALPMGEKDRLFMVVFITDGRPTLGERDPERIVKTVAEKNASQARVFTFGVGFDLDVRLLDRIAESTQAARDYVMPQEDLEVVTSRFFRKVSQPVLSDVRLELGAGVHDVYPQRLPDLFAGGQVVVMGRYRETGDRVIRLKGKVGGREVTHEYEATFGASEGAPYLHRLWAHRKVAYLLDAIRLNGEDKELVDEIVRLATRYGIVTPYTAGLVVEETELLDGRRPGTLGLTAPRGEDRGREIARRLREGLPPPSPSAPTGGGGFEPGRSGGAPAEAPAPDAEAKTSDALARMKSGERPADGTDADDPALDAVRERVQTAADKTFLLGQDGRWIDTAYDGKQETTKVEAYAEAWMALLAKGERIAKYLALGEKVVFVLEGKAYEVVPPKEDAGAR